MKPTTAAKCGKMCMLLYGVIIVRNGQTVHVLLLTFTSSLIEEVRTYCRLVVGIVLIPLRLPRWQQPCNRSLLMLHSRTLITNVKELWHRKVCCTYKQWTFNLLALYLFLFLKFPIYYCFKSSTTKLAWYCFQRAYFFKGKPSIRIWTILCLFES